VDSVRKVVRVAQAVPEHLVERAGREVLAEQVGQVAPAARAVPEARETTVATAIRWSRGR
jgi:hypothetical protein